MCILITIIYNYNINSYNQMSQKLLLAGLLVASIFLSIYNPQD